jgi:NADH:ubiquinone oxidoreductase subunit 5 (subunit L)/multisubunit Na+/H+ antiporter MnhA subunit
MLVPMGILAFLSVVGGWPMFTFFNKLKTLFPEHAHGEHLVFNLSEAQLNWGLSLLVVALAAYTIRLYLKKPKTVEKLATTFEKLADAGENEYHVNQGLMNAGASLVKGSSYLSSILEISGIEAILHSLTKLTRHASSWFSKIQHGVPQTYVLYILIGAVFLIYFIVGA